MLVGHAFNTLTYSRSPHGELGRGRDGGDGVTLYLCVLCDFESTAASHKRNLTSDPAVAARAYHTRATLETIFLSAG